MHKADILTADYFFVWSMFDRCFQSPTRIDICDVLKPEAVFMISYDYSTHRFECI